MTVAWPASRALAAFAAHVWRGSLALVLLAASTVHLVTVELARALLRLRLRYDSSHASLPSAISSSSTASGGGTWASWKAFVTSGPRRARKQSHAAMDFLEKFRQGPETHSEWNLFLWRATFPLVSLVLFTLLCVAGKFGHTAYSLLVCPIWYFCNLALVTTPFLLVFRFSALEDADAHTRLWRALGAVSFGISLVEWYISAPASRYSWIVGNTLFGIVALCALPMFFSVQQRSERSQYEALVIEQEHGASMQELPEDEDSDEISEPMGSLHPGGGLAAAAPGLASALLHQMDVYSPRASSVSPSTYDTLMGDGEHRLTPPLLSLGARQRSGTLRTSNGSTRQARSQQFEPQQQQQGQSGSRLLYGCGFCALVLWLVMFSSYSSARGAEASTRSWFLLYLLSPVLCVMLFCVRAVRTRFSFEHAVAYSSLVVHVPLFLGHLCVRLFALAEDSGGASSSSSSGESWLKLAISVLYLLLMQGYFFVITHMVNSMSEPFAHPSLLYVGQLYYYVFWYILVGSDTPIDALYWGMLLVNNVHIAFLNTGVYTDFKRSSSAWLAVPLQANVTSSIALCLRSTTTTMDVSRCLHHQGSSRRQGLLGLNCGVAGAAAAMDTEADRLEDGEHECECDSGSDAEGFAVFRGAGEEEGDTSSALPSWQGSGSRIRERDRSAAARKDVQVAAGQLLSPSRKAAARQTSSLRDKCARVQVDCSRCGARTSGPSRSGSGSVAPVASTAPSTTTPTSETLRPLYFLMKLAEQDNMADTTALILVPSLLTLLAVFEKPGHALTVLQDQTNLWLRCVCMFIGRLGGAFLAREIFACKLRSRLRSSPEDLGETEQPDVMSGTIDGLPARLWIQRLMLQDFHAQFWYLTAVTMVVTFACFDRIDLPLRFALLS
ncbi:hypothetical protein BBJ28_00008728 [Nothophytophthora sp. Chile5]|nr:hypothetical protein BBJ28_00008728 [Nothophytophthora sp. Chile5]